MAYSLVVPNASEIRMLEYILNIKSADNPKLWLYTLPDVIPDEDSLIGDFTLIASSDIELDPLLWVISTINGVGVAEYPTQLYDALPVDTVIYGYVVTNNASNCLLWAQRCFFAPVNITVSAPTFSVTPRFNASSTS
jgi:hypothetical protein